MQLDNMEEVKKAITEFKSIFTNIYDVKKDIEDQLAIKDDETGDEKNRNIYNKWIRKWIWKIKIVGGTNE